MSLGVEKLPTKNEYTKIRDIVIVQPKVFTDARGWFLESHNEKACAEKAGISVRFVQDNHSCSKYSDLRGLHYLI